MWHGGVPTKLVVEGDPTVLVVDSIPTDLVVEGIPTRLVRLAYNSKSCLPAKAKQDVGHLIFLQIAELEMTNCLLG